MDLKTIHFSRITDRSFRVWIPKELDKAPLKDYLDLLSIHGKADKIGPYLTGWTFLNEVLVLVERAFEKTGLEEYSAKETSIFEVVLGE